MGTRFIGLFVATILFLSLVTPSLAVTAPSFPSCLNPQGTLTTSYSDGVHGVPGDTHAYTGSDKVYTLSQTQTLQCLCQSNGNGIQTQWLKATGYTDDEIKSLTLSGWIYIADGSAWGLDADPYLAKNSTYSCKSTTNSSSSSNSGGSSSSSSSSSSDNGGQVLDGISTGVLGQVLGLASTGNLEKVYDLWLIGLLLLTAGVWLKWLHTRQLGKKS